MTRDDVRTRDGSAATEARGVTFTRSKPAPSVRVLEVRGDLDVAISGVLGHELSELLRLDLDRVDLDLSGVSFMDSSALRILVQAHEHAKELGRDFNLVRPSSACTKVLGITGLDRVFNLR